MYFTNCIQLWIGTTGINKQASKPGSAHKKGQSSRCGVGEIDKKGQHLQPTEREKKFSQPYISCPKADGFWKPVINFHTLNHCSILPFQDGRNKSHKDPITTESSSRTDMTPTRNSGSTDLVSVDTNIITTSGMYSTTGLILVHTFS